MWWIVATWKLRRKQFVKNVMLQWVKSIFSKQVLNLLRKWETSFSCSRKLVLENNNWIFTIMHEYCTNVHKCTVTRYKFFFFLPFSSFGPFIFSLLGVSPSSSFLYMTIYVSLFSCYWLGRWRVHARPVLCNLRPKMTIQNEAIFTFFNK